MQTADEILKPYIEIPFRHTKIVSDENALLAMKKFAGQRDDLLKTKLNWLLKEYVDHVNDSDKITETLEELIELLND